MNQLYCAAVCMPGTAVDQHRDHATTRADDGGDDRGRVVALACTSTFRLVDMVNRSSTIDLLLAHQVVVGDQDAEQRADEGAEGVQRVVDDVRDCCTGSTA